MIFIDRVKKGQTYTCPEACPKPLTALEDAQKLLFSAPAGQWECEFQIEGEKRKMSLKDAPNTGTSLRFYEKQEEAPLAALSVDQQLAQLRLMLQQTLSPILGNLRADNHLDTDPQPLLDECVDDLILRLCANIKR